MNIKMSSVIIWEGKAYVPFSAKYRNGIFTDIEPVQIFIPHLDDLVSAVEKVLETEPELLPDPTREEVKIQYNMLPKTTGARSWKRLCQLGINYTIDRSDKGYALEISRLDSKGRWEFDPNKRKIFPPNTDLSVVIQALLDDLATRPKQIKSK